MSAEDMTIRPATEADFPTIHTLFQEILEEGYTHSYTPEEMPEPQSHAYWLSAPGTHGFVAEIGGRFAGVYAIRPNRTGRAGHVANASFMVHPAFRGRGVGRALGLHALEEARRLGYRSMLFRFVVSANEAAVNLWKSLGFEVVGVLPEGFDHAERGLVDVLLMHRKLQ